MPLLENTFELCKKISKSPFRDSIKSLLKSLNTVSGNDINTPKDRSQFGYLARQTNAQFLSYLLVDSNRSQIEQLMPVPIINAEEKRILENAHQQILNLNLACLEPLKVFANEYLDAANPYFGFLYPIQEKITENPFLSPADIQAFSKVFALSEPMQRVLKFQPQVINSYPANNAPTLMKVLREKIMQAGVDKSPQDFHQIFLLQKRIDSNQDAVLKFIYSLLCAKATLDIVNRFIFQVFISDQLVTVNENNIIRIITESHTLTGTGFIIDCQPDEKLSFVNEGHLILKNDAGNKQYCLIEGMNISYSHKLGSVQRLFLRLVDKNLNPYYGLLQRL